MVIGELALMVYAIATVGVALWQGNVFAVPFLMLYVTGFGYVGLTGVWEARRNLEVWLRRFFGRHPASEKRGASPGHIVAPGQNS